MTFKDKRIFINKNVLKMTFLIVAVAPLNLINIVIGSKLVRDQHDVLAENRTPKGVV